MTQSGYDPALEAMIRLKYPLTLSNYLALNYPGRDYAEEPLEAEEMSMLPLDHLDPLTLAEQALLDPVP